MELVAEFERVFRRKPELIASAPGVVNLAGDDSGHDSGLVLAVALERRVRVAMARRPDRRAFLRSTAFGGESALALDKLDRSWGWGDPVAAVVALFERKGLETPGFELYVEGDLPLGAGFASSAALEMAVAAGLDVLSGARLSLPDRAGLCWQAENEFLDAGEAITPFLAAATAREGNVVLVDCHDRTTRLIELEPSEYRFVLIDSGLRKHASQSEAEQIASECRKVLDAVRSGRPEFEKLQDLAVTDLQGLEERLAKRGRHILGETDRVRRAAEALEGGALGVLGKLLTESHQSLSENVGVEMQDLESLVRVVQTAPGILGARLARERSPGCVVALAHEKALAPLEERVTRFYAGRTGRTPEVISFASPGGPVSVQAL